MNNVPRLIVAAPSSGSGKSVIASGLMAAFSARFPVQGFKVGPDYIDPMYHTAASGRISRNLDTWMLSDEQVRRLFIQASRGASLSIIEGVMGLFDGCDGDPFLGSTAAVSRLLKAPVILVIDCSKISGSAAAIVHGFNTFCRSIRIAGVICNRVGSERHCKWLTDAIERRNSIAVLGCVPRLPELQIPERHLGLFTVAERDEEVKEFIDRASLILAGCLDLDRLLDIANMAEPLPEIVAPEPKIIEPSVRLAVAWDEAFCFYYEDNLEELRRCGAEIVPFSPLTDERLPENISGIYLGGGYPELYAQQLSRNARMRDQILTCCRLDMPVYAECGGLMYLTKGIRSAQGDFLMTGAIPGWCEMGKKLNMGYREVETIRPCLLAAAGAKLRGHEFHYSCWITPDMESCVYQLGSQGLGDLPKREGYAIGNILASYIHLHFSQNRQLAKNFVARCRHWREKHNNIQELLL